MRRLAGDFWSSVARWFADCSAFRSCLGSGADARRRRDRRCKGGPFMAALGASSPLLLPFIAGPAEDLATFAGASLKCPAMLGTLLLQTSPVIAFGLSSAGLLAFPICLCPLEAATGPGLASMLGVPSREAETFLLGAAVQASGGRAALEVPAGAAGRGSALGCSGWDGWEGR